MKIKKGLLIVLLIFGSFMLMGLMFLMTLRSFFDTTPVVRNNSVLKITLNGIVPEWFARDAFSREFEGGYLQLHDIRKVLRIAEVDKRIKGIYLRIVGQQMGWAKAEEIRRCITDFKKGGKFVTAFVDYCDEQSYYIALAADEIYAPPHAFAAMNGFSAEVPFLKGTFEKLGIHPQVDNIGKYKSAGDILKRDSMSPAHREATEAILQDVYENFTSVVSDSREIPETKLAALLDEGVFNSDDLDSTGLIDGLKYEGDVLELIKTEVYGEDAADDQKLELISARNYMNFSLEDFGLEGDEEIGLIYAIGTILPGHGGHDAISGRTMGAESIGRMLRDARDNDDVKAVVLRVDSPGGSSQASDQIWAEIERLREKKPVVISMSDVAASGGYWIAMNCDGIVADPLTITGSIGVVLQLFDLSGTYKKLGINWELVKQGAKSDVPTDKRPLSPEEWEVFKHLNRDIYRLFVQKVADGRGKTWDEVHEIAQGRVWTGKRAKEIGLVDSLGGLQTALELAKEKAGIAPETMTRWHVYPQPKSFFQSLFERLNVLALRGFMSTDSDGQFIKHLPQEVRSLLHRVSLLQIFRNGDVLALETNIPQIK